MTETFDITFANGNPLITIDGGLFLVDTGASRSMSVEPDCHITLCGNNYTLNPLLGIERKIPQIAGGDVRGLIGTDILADHNVHFDYRAKQVTFSDTFPPPRQRRALVCGQRSFVT